MIPNARRQSFAAECAPNHPRFERTKTTSELHPVIHVIDLCAHWVAEMEVLEHESKDQTQSSRAMLIRPTGIQHLSEHAGRCPRRYRSRSPLFLPNYALDSRCKYETWASRVRSNRTSAYSRQLVHAQRQARASSKLKPYRKRPLRTR